MSTIKAYKKRFIASLMALLMVLSALTGAIVSQSEQSYASDIPSHFIVRDQVIGNGGSAVSQQVTLKANNTYYLEIAGGSGGDDSWYIWGNATDWGEETRYYVDGGNGGYQLVKIVPSSNVTLTLYAGGEGTSYESAGYPDGQSPSGGGSSSVWVGKAGSGGTLLFAAGGGGAAVGGTSDLPGYDGEGGYAQGPNGVASASEVYHNFAATFNGHNGRTFTSWASSANTDTWRSIIVQDVNYFDKGGYLNGQDRIPGWTTSNTFNDFVAKFILYGDNIEGGGGGGGFPAGECSYYHWAGWYMSNGWYWVSNDMKHSISGGGYGYTANSSLLSQYGITATVVDAQNGYNDGQGYVKLWAEAFTLTVNPNGGIYATSAGNTLYNKEYLDVVTVSDPTRTGYTFLGWSRTGGGLWDSSTKQYTFQKVNETFTAQWKADVYTITYYGLDGSSLAGTANTNPTTYTYDTATFTLKNPTKEGYRFAGWVGTDVPIASTAVAVPKGSTGNRTYTATWTKLATVPLDGKQNLAYQPTTKTDASGKTVQLYQGGVDLDWSKFTDYSICGGYYIYYKLQTSTSYSKYSSTSQAYNVMTRAFNNSNSAETYVYDRTAPNTIKEWNYSYLPSAVKITWNAVEDNGTLYTFKVTARDSFYGLLPYQQVLNMAGYTAAQCKTVTSLNALLSNSTYVNAIRNNSSAKQLLKYYYASDLNTLIDSIYNATFNRLNYELGLKAYLIKSGVPTDLLPASGWTYGYVRDKTIGGSASSNTSSSEYDAAWVTDFDAKRFTTDSGEFVFASHCKAVFKSKTAINTSTYSGGQLVAQVTGHSAGVGSSTVTLGLSNNSSGYYNSLSTISYASGTLGNGEYSTSIVNYGTLAGTWNRTEGTRVSWANAQWNVSTASGLKVKASSASSDFGLANSTSALISSDRTTTVSLSLTSSKVGTAQYLTLDSGSSYWHTSITNLYLAPGTVSGGTAPSLPAEETSLWTSTPVDIEVKTGLYGYLYKVDTSSSTTVNWTNGTFQTTNSVTVAPSTTMQYVHVATVDKAGNVGATVHMPTATVGIVPTIQYTVHYNGNGNVGGSTADSSHVYNIIKNLTTNGFTKTGYTFKGWDTDESGDSVVYTNGQSVVNLTTINNDIINLYASWAPITYTIRYNPNGATGSKPDLSMTYDVSKNLSGGDEYSMPGYTFVGWSKTPNATLADGIDYLAGQTVKNLTSTQGEVINLYAVWLENLYNIEFDGNGATSGDMDPVNEVKFTETITLPANEFEKEGYEFVGWELTITNGSHIDYADRGQVTRLTTTPGGTVVLHAKWKKVVTLRYDYNQGKDSSGRSYIEVKKEIYNDTNSVTFDITTTEPTRTWYDFMGWTVNEVKYPTADNNPWEEHWIGTDASGNNVYCHEGEYCSTSSSLASVRLENGSARKTTYTVTGLKNSTKNSETIYAVWEVQHVSNATLERCLGNESDPLVFRRGERGIVYVTAVGYADKVDIEFPNVVEVDKDDGDTVKTTDSMDGHYSIYLSDSEYEHINPILDRLKIPHGFTIPLYFGDTDYDDDNPTLNEIDVDVHFTYKGREETQSYTFNYYVSETVLDQLRTRIRIRIRSLDTP